MPKPQALWSLKWSSFPKGMRPSAEPLAIGYSSSSLAHSSNLISMLSPTTVRLLSVPISRHAFRASYITPRSSTFASQRTMSTELKTFNSKKAAQPIGPYSQAVIAGPHIFVSGQIPADAEGNLIEGSIADKTKACCEGLKNILADAGSDISKVVKVPKSFPGGGVV